MIDVAKKKNSIYVMMIILFLTKVLGLFKLRVISHLFGATHELDIFWASFTIPDMIFMVLVAGSVNAAIIPILTDQLYDRGKKSLNELFKKITMYFFLLCFLFVLIAFILAPTITEWIINSESASTILNIGFRMTQADYPLFLRLFRIGLLSPLFLSISAFVTSYLQVRKQFFVTSLAPLFYDLAMIFGTYILVGIFKMDAEYTKKIENTLNEYGLEYIPEAHNYLKIVNEYDDFTNPNSQYSDLEDKILEESEIEYNEIYEEKIKTHKLFFEKWIQDC